MTEIKKTMACPFNGVMGNKKTIMWEITRQCNLLCEHCITSSGTTETSGLKTDELLEAIEVFANNKVDKVYITGGEPLLRKDIFEIIAKLKEKKIFVQLATNGTIITDEIADYLKKMDVRVQISVDDIRPDYHNRFRNSEDAFTRTILGIRRLVERGVEVYISTMVTNENYMYIDKMAIFMTWLGVRALTFSNVYNMGRAENKTFGLSDNISEEVTDKLETIKKLCYPYLLISYPRFVKKNANLPLNGCIGGKNILYITAEGDIYPCSYAEKMDERFLLGNIKDKNLNLFSLPENHFLSHIYKKLNSEETKICSDCEHNSMCGRGCSLIAKTCGKDDYSIDHLCPKIRNMNENE